MKKIVLKPSNFKGDKKAGEMVQHLKALAALAEDPDLAPSLHMAVHN